MLFSHVNFTQTYDVSSTLAVMLRVAEDTENLGKTIQCLAELSDDSVMFSKSIKVVDSAVSYIEERGRSPLTDEINVDLVDVVVSNTLAGMRSIDHRCWVVSSYCPARRTPQAAVELADLGKVLEKSGATMSCLLTKKGPAILPKIIEIFGKYVDSEAHHDAALNTSLAILLPQETLAADELQGVSADCANAVKSCY